MADPGGAPAFPAADIFEPQLPADGKPAVLRATDLTGVHVLKHENLFMLSDAYGDIHEDGRGLGLYDTDTRVLSTYDLRLNGVRPVVLRAGPAASYRSTIQLTNPDFVTRSAEHDGAEIGLRRQSLGIVRERVMSEGFGEQISVENYTMQPERARLTLRLDADFADIFELRGLFREHRGERLPTRRDGGRVEFGYRGLDGAVRRTHVRLSPPMTLVDAAGGPPEVGPVTLELDSVLAPGERVTLAVDVWTEVPRLAADDGAEPSLGDDVPAVPDERPTADEKAEPEERLHVSADQPAAMHRAWRSSSAAIETSDVLAERALARASADLRLLLNSGPAEGERYVAAGVPWFSCLFGRDSIITSLQLLCVRPQIARSTLAILGRLQATEADDWRDAQPGKILHELREGELARTREIPHSPYYGTVDATPLWLMLLDEYERWTADTELIERLWPNALLALRWMDEYGDVDGDGLIEYERMSHRGLLNQGWKDSGDAIRNRDGSLAEGPIALVEVQGYAYAARRGLARLARLRGDLNLAEQQEQAAERLRARFEEAFWMDDIGTYALALDGQKRRVDAVASNAGHTLWTGICTPERAASVARVLTGPGMWSGWGIRTLSSQTVGYNPIGYHLGTIWPHDNAICAAGFAHYGLFDEARLVAGSLVEATSHFREARLPELFCGFERERSPFPVPYPVACSPQAWAAGSVFHLISATLGMRPDAGAHRLELLRPSLPASIPMLRMRNLRVGDALVDMEFSGVDGSISVEVLHRQGDLDVVVRL